MKKIIMGNRELSQALAVGLIEKNISFSWNKNTFTLQTKRKTRVIAEIISEISDQQPITIEY